MNIRDARVDWNEKYANPPRLDVLVDEIPDSVRFDRVDLGDGIALYYGETESGYVEYYVHNPADETGFGGRTFHLEMWNGSTEQVKVWSGRAGVVNKLGIGPVVDVGITDDPERFEEGLTLRGGSITLEAAMVAVDHTDASHLGKVERFTGDEPYWVPMRAPEQEVEAR